MFLCGLCSLSLPLQRLTQGALLILTFKEKLEADAEGENVNLINANVTVNGYG